MKIDGRKTNGTATIFIIVVLLFAAIGIRELWAYIVLCIVNYNLVEIMKRSATKKIEKGNGRIGDQIQLIKQQKYF